MIIKLVCLGRRPSSHAGAQAPAATLTAAVPRTSSTCADMWWLCSTRCCRIHHSGCRCSLPRFGTCPANHPISSCQSPANHPRRSTQQSTPSASIPHSTDAFTAIHPPPTHWHFFPSIATQDVHHFPLEAIESVRAHGELPVYLCLCVWHSDINSRYVRQNILRWQKRMVLVVMILIVLCTCSLNFMYERVCITGYCYQAKAQYCIASREPQHAATTAPTYLRDDR